VSLKPVPLFAFATVTEHTGWTSLVLNASGKNRAVMRDRIAKIIANVTTPNHMLKRMERKSVGGTLLAARTSMERHTTISSVIA